MANFPSEVTKEEIQNYIESEQFKLFHKSIRKEFNIEDMDYELVCRDMARDDGFPDLSTKGRTIMDDKWEHVELVLYDEALMTSINNKFSKLPALLFQRAMELCIKFTLVHELVHIQQYKYGKLTKKKSEELKNIPYEERDVEIEANSVAEQIISRESQFERKIVSIFTSSESIDNDNLHKILALYN